MREASIKERTGRDKYSGQSGRELQGGSQVRTSLPKPEGKRAPEAWSRRLRRRKQKWTKNSYLSVLVPKLLEELLVFWLFCRVPCPVGAFRLRLRLRLQLSRQVSSALLICLLRESSWGLRTCEPPCRRGIGEAAIAARQEAGMGLSACLQREEHKRAVHATHSRPHLLLLAGSPRPQRLDHRHALSHPSLLGVLP